ncbi:MAG: BPSS1780 family membrane protein [Gammaproteobacteria bacterium]
MAASYRIITEGKLCEGVSQEQFISAFVQTFKVPEEQARKLLLAGRPVTLKDNLDRDTAEKFKRVLIEQIGLEVRIESKDELKLTSDVAVSGNTESSSGTTSESSARCPKCGSERVSGDECLDCGIIISRYQARRTQAKNNTSSSGAGWNPYQSTATQDVHDDDDFGARVVDVGDGWHWIVGGWKLFVKNPWAWIATLVIWYVMMFVVGLIPIIGSFGINILSPVFMGGLMLGANEQASGGDFTVGHLFQGFSTQFGKLVQAGLLYLAVSIVVVLVGAIIVALFGMGALLNHGGEAASANGPSIIAIFFVVIIALIAMVLLGMAFYFVPMLIVFDEHGPIAAITQSFSACWKNMIPFLIYGLIMFGLAVIAMIPIGLGLFVLAPVMIASMYVSYRHIFHGEI